MIKKITKALTSRRKALLLAVFLFPLLGLSIYFGFFWKSVAPAEGGTLEIKGFAKVNILPDGIDARARVKVSSQKVLAGEALSTDKIEVGPQGIFIDMGKAYIIKPIFVAIKKPEGWNGQNMYACRYDPAGKALSRAYGREVGDMFEFHTRVPGNWYLCRLKNDQTPSKEEIASIEKAGKAMFHMPDDSWKLIRSMQKSYSDYAEAKAKGFQATPGSVATPDEKKIGEGQLVKVGDEVLIIADTDLPGLSGIEGELEEAACDKSGSWVRDKELAFKAAITASTTKSIKDLNFQGLAETFRDKAEGIAGMKHFADAGPLIKDLKDGDRDAAIPLIARTELKLYSEKLLKTAELLDNYNDTAWAYEQEVRLFMLLSDIVLTARPLSELASSVFPEYGENLDIGLLADEPALKSIAANWVINEHAVREISPVVRLGYEARESLPKKDDLALEVFDAALNRMEEPGPILTYFTYVRAIREEYLPFAEEYAGVRYALSNMRKLFTSTSQIIGTLKEALKQQDYSLISDMCLNNIEFQIEGCYSEVIECSAIEQTLKSEEQIDWAKGADHPTCPTMKMSIKDLFLGPYMLQQYIQQKPLTLIRSENITVTFRMPSAEDTILKFKLHILRHKREGYLLKKIDYILDF